jgi:hypothetical protein
MLSDAERDLLNTALEKYRLAQSEPVLAGCNKMIKPALRLITSYRLVIEEITDAEVITSYTRWVDAVQVREAENQEVYLRFNPRFEHIWLRIEETSLGVRCRETGQYWTPKSICPPALRLGEKVRVGGNEAHFIGAASKSARAGVGKRYGWKDHPRSAFTGLGELSPESFGYCRRRNQQEDGFKRCDRVVGAIKTSTRNNGDFCD